MSCYIILVYQYYKLFFIMRYFAPALIMAAVKARGIGGGIRQGYSNGSLGSSHGYGYNLGNGYSHGNSHG